MKQRTNRVFPYFYDPGSRLFYVAVELSDSPGALRLLLQALEKKLNLIETSSYTLGEGSAIFSGFAQPLRAESIASIRELISKVQVVKAYDVWEDEGGLLVDQLHAGTQSNIGDVYTLVPSRGLAGVFEKLVHTFGTGGTVILYLEGLEFGTQRLRPLKGKLSSDLSKAVKQVSDIARALGYGRMAISFKNGRGSLSVTVSECFESSAPTKCGRRCSFMRGLVTGLMNELMDRDFDCEEVQCTLKGDEVCEFALVPRS